MTDQPGAEYPQEHVLGNDRGEQRTKGFAVDIDIGLAVDIREEHFQVADHVGDGEANDAQVR